MSNKLTPKAKAWFIFAGVLLIIVLLICLPKDTPVHLSSEELKNARRDSLHYCYLLAEMQIKESLNDPESYVELGSLRGFNDSTGINNRIWVNIWYKSKEPSGKYVSTGRCFNFNQSMTIVRAVKCP